MDDIHEFDTPFVAGDMKRDINMDGMFHNMNMTASNALPWISNVTCDNSSHICALNNTSQPTELSSRQWSVLLLIVIVILGLLGNLLVCIAIIVEKKLQSVTNAFLMSLAVADMLVSVLVMPCSMVHQLMGYWPFGIVLCDMWLVADVMLCTSSIMHMCVISIDRYICIKNPLKTRITSKHKVALKIAVVWLIAFAIASPIIILGIYRPQDLLTKDLQCGIFNRYFVIYGSFAAFFIPLLLMLGTYSLTIHILRKKVCKGEKQDGGLRRMMTRRVRRMSQVPLAPRFRHKLPGNIDRKSNHIPANPAELEPLNAGSSDSEDIPVPGKKKNKYLFSALCTAAHGLALPVYQPIQRTVKTELKANDHKINGHISREQKNTSDSLINTPRPVPGIIYTNVSSENVSAISGMESHSSVRSESLTTDILPEELETEKYGESSNKRSGEPTGSDTVDNSGSKGSSNRANILVTLKNNSTECISELSTSNLNDCDSQISKVDSDTQMKLLGKTELGYDNENEDHENGVSQDRRSSRVVANDGFHLGGNCIIKSDKQCENVMNALGRSVNNNQSSSAGTDSSIGESSGKTLNLESSQPAAMASESWIISSPTTSQTSINTTDSLVDTRASTRIEDICTVSPITSTHAQDAEMNPIAVSQSSIQNDSNVDTGNTSVTSSTSSMPPGRDIIEEDSQQKLHTSLPIVPPIITINGDNIQSTGSLHVPFCVKDKKRNSCPDAKDRSWKDTAPKPKKSVWSRLSHPDTSLAALIEPLRKSAWARLSHPNVSSSSKDSGDSKSKQKEDDLNAPRFKTLVKKHSAAFRVAAILTQRRENLKNKEMRTVKTEQKAMKVLGAMFFIFVLCWAPFFTLNLTQGICYHSCSVQPIVFIVCVWIGYASSILNPIIYTIFNNTFKETFTTLLLCRYCKADYKDRTRNNSVRSNNRFVLGNKTRFAGSTMPGANTTELVPLDNGRTDQ